MLTPRSSPNGQVRGSAGGVHRDGRRWSRGVRTGYNSNSTPALAGYARPIMNYFAIAAQIHTRKDSIPLPICTFTINNNTAIHLAYDPSIWQITTNDAVEKFGLPDLRPTLAAFLNKEKAMGPSAIHPIGGQRRVSDDCPLPFTELQVWFKVQIQNTEFHDPNMFSHHKHFSACHQIGIGPLDIMTQQLSITIQHPNGPKVA